MTLAAPKAVMEPSKDAVAFLKNGFTVMVSEVFGDRSFNAFLPGEEGAVSFKRHDESSDNRYMPVPANEWKRYKKPDETPEDWLVMYFVEAYKAPHIFKPGDEGYTKSGLRYYVVRSDAGTVTAALWSPASWVTRVGYFSPQGEFRNGNEATDYRADLVPPST